MLDAGRVATPSAAEWDRVRRVRVRVRQEYRYVYPSPVTELRQRLVMLPRAQYGGQCVVDSDLHVTGADGAVVRRESDRFGNDVWHVTAPRVREAVAFSADFSVECSAPAEPVYLPDSAPLGLYLAPTALTAPNDRIAGVARAIADALAREAPLLNETRHETETRRQWAAARRVAEWTADAITYQHGITGVQTPAAMALHLGRGVCQDYAHIAIALMRQLRVPARYVSGHVLGEGAPHAWLEALLPDPDTPGRVRAVAFDPTHRRTPRVDYITVAVGRDFSDITPTSGTFSGVPGRFTARKDAWLEECE